MVCVGTPHNRYLVPFGAWPPAAIFGREAVEHNAHPNIEYRFQDYREATGSLSGLGLFLGFRV